MDLQALAIGQADRTAASSLLTILLVYGSIMLLLSGVQTHDVLKVIDVFGVVATNSAVLILCVFAVAAMVRPALIPQWKDRLFWVAVSALILGLTLTFYGIFKQLVLPTRGFLWDRALSHTTRLIFGHPAWIFTHRYFGTVAATRFLDEAYALWMPLMFALPLVAPLVIRDPKARFRLVASWLLAWIVIGTVAAWAFASAGPCFYNVFVGRDPSYLELARRLADLGRQAAAEGHPIRALEYQPALIAFYHEHDLVPAAGISAMPSMHVGMATLFALAAWRAGAFWGTLFTLYALIIWTASIHFGWHYFLDGPVAATMMTGIWLVTGRLARLIYDRDPLAGPE